MYSYRFLDNILLKTSCESKYLWRRRLSFIEGAKRVERNSRFYRIYLLALWSGLGLGPLNWGNLDDAKEETLKSDRSVVTDSWEGERSMREPRVTSGALPLSMTDDRSLGGGETVRIAAPQSPPPSHHATCPADPKVRLVGGRYRSSRVRRVAVASYR